MNAKIEQPYEHDEPTGESWIKSKAAKITGIAAGGALVLAGTFAAGLAVGATAAHIGPGNAPGIAGFDRDGGHKFPGEGGQRPPRPGDHDGDDRGGFQMPEPTETPASQNG